MPHVESNHVESDHVESDHLELKTASTQHEWGLFNKTTEIVNRLKNTFKLRFIHVLCERLFI
jgi:hypothetical protein